MLYLYMLRPLNVLISHCPPKGGSEKGDPEKGHCNINIRDFNMIFR